MGSRGGCARRILAPNRPAPRGGLEGRAPALALLTYSVSDGYVTTTIVRTVNADGHLGRVVYTYGAP